MATIYDGLEKKATAPKKTIKSITHTRSHNGHTISVHKHHPPHDHEMHDETHTHSNMADVHSHLEDHMGTPNEGEAAPDANTPQLTASPAPAPAAGGATPTAGM